MKYRVLPWLLLLIACVMIVSSCARSTVQESSVAEKAKPAKTEESSAEESSEEETSSEESVEEPESEEPESSAELVIFEESVEESIQEEEPEAELPPGFTPVQTDSPVDAFYCEVPGPGISLDDVPEYSGEISVEMNGGIPYLEGDEMEEIQIWLTPLDDLGRCGTVMMLAGPETLPTAKRKSISAIHPTGWQQNMYPDLISDSNGALYRRCHMLMFALSGLNATEENLITGTGALNSKGMNGKENQVLEYIRNTGHHVVYRCTPFFQGDELLARGVLMEALSLEDDEISLCMFCYNVQPGIELDYATGANHLIETESEDVGTRSMPEDEESETEEESETLERSIPEHDYVLNTNTHKFHYPDCKSVKQMKDKNKKEVHCTRDEVIAQGYEPCKNCNP